MDIVHESPEKTRPKPSPLLREWTQHPQRIADALADAAGTVEQARELKRSLDQCARGDLDPDTPGLRMAWAFLGMAGAHGLLDEQRRWYAKHVGVSDKTVTKYRAELEGTSEVPKSTTRLTSDGRTRKAKLDKSDSAPSFTCNDCGESFSTEVWHCPHCDHHHGPDRDQCNNCHEPRIPDGYEEVDGGNTTTSEIIDTTTGEVLEDAAASERREFVDDRRGEQTLHEFHGRKNPRTLSKKIQLDPLSAEWSAAQIFHEFDGVFCEELAAKLIRLGQGGAA